MESKEEILLHTGPTFWIFKIGYIFQTVQKGAKNRVKKARFFYLPLKNALYASGIGGKETPIFENFPKKISKNFKISPKIRNFSARKSEIRKWDPTHSLWSPLESCRARRDLSIAPLKREIRWREHTQIHPFFRFGARHWANTITGPHPKWEGDAVARRFS